MFGWENLSATSTKGRFAFLVVVMAIATLLSLLEAVLLRTAVPLAVALLGWVFVVVYTAVDATLFHRAGRAMGSLVLPSGDATPSANQHSDLQALVARGACAQAAEAYRQVIAAEPGDLVACEQLTQLALRELKDYELALFAARAGERGAPERRRKAGYALMVVGVLRDHVNDSGRTLVELRRVLSTYPELPNADRLRRELEDLKARHFEAP